MRGRLLLAGSVLALLVLAAPAPAGAALSRHRLRAGLAKQMRQVGGQSGSWVMDVGARHRPVLFKWAARSPRTLASNTKLFTTSAVLDRFGARHRIATKLWQDGTMAGAGNHVLRGSLDLVGAGDPALGTEAFAQAHGLPLSPLGGLIAGVRQAGIRFVRSGIVADDTVFDRLRGVAATGWAPSPDLSPLSGLSFDSGFDGAHYASDPALVAGRALKHDLQAAGVRVQGGVTVADAPAGVRAAPPLAVVRSPTISTLIAATNKPSNDFFAEMLLKRLAAHPEGGGTTARGAARAERFARRLGVRVRMEDGSGLSHSDEASARQVGRLLVAMTRHSGAAVFRHSLAIAGVDGTLVDRMRGTPAQGRCFAKTGTLSGVSALSGYCKAGHGLVAFSILMNGIGDIGAAEAAQDRMVELIARYR